MQFKHPEYIFGVVIFGLLLFLLSKIRKRGYFYSSKIAVKPAGFFLHLLNALPTLLYLATVTLLLVALAAPFEETTKRIHVLEGKVLVPCIDVSASMDMSTPEGEYKIELVKKLLKEFLETRGQVDAVGLTAFSGGGDQWGAGIIQRPTMSKELFLAASKKIRSQMFGGTTAIGEGIFFSILAINEMDWHKKTQEETGDPNKEFDVERLWAAMNTIDLPEFGLPEENEKIKDDYIISEAARLAPPALNKNKVIILFSDGDSNTGIDPIKTIWLARRLGIKVYYIEVLGTYSAPATAADAPPHRVNLVRAVTESGGKYFGAQNYNDVRDFFMRISRLETGKIATRDIYETTDSYEFWIKIACVVFLFWIVFEVITNL